MSFRKMLRWALAGVAFLAWGAAAPRAGEEAKDAPPQAEVKLPAKEKFHLFLLVGQSNMAGRGKVEDEDRVVHPRVLTLDKDDKWAPAVDPIHFDKPVAGVCMGRGFGIAVTERDPEITVGLVPCAVGGTVIAQWSPKGKLYAEAVRRTRLAMEQGTLKGILWHQGESNAIKNDKSRAAYEADLIRLVASFRQDFGAPELPFIAGELGRYLAPPDGPEMNGLLKSLDGKIKNFGCASSEGLNHKGDKLHFDGPAQREFGRRYAAIYFKLSAPEEKKPGQ